MIGTATSEAGAEKISAAFARVRGGMALNVTDPDSATLLKSIQSDYAAPQILIDNAGITKDNLLMRMSDDEWFDVVNTNLSAVFRLSSVFARHDEGVGAKLLILALRWVQWQSWSIQLRRHKSRRCSFARALAKEVGSRHITVNTVSPVLLKQI